MRTDLSAASRHEHLALYDPAALPDDLALDPDLTAQAPEPPPLPAVRQLAAEGRALVIRIASEDCEARLAVLHEEELDPTVRARGAVVLSDARLRLPAGRIRADGVEFMCRPGEERPEGAGTSASLPAGEYGLEVIEFLNWKLRAVPAMRGATTRLERLAHRMVVAYTWVGIVMLPANVFLAPIVLILAYSNRGLRGAALAAAIILFVDVVIFGGFWLLQLAQRRFPAMTRVRHLQEELDRTHPDIIVLLRRPAPSPATARPAFAEIRV